MRNETTRHTWRRSFYWRIAGGFVLCLIGVLAAQASAMFWLVDRAELGDGPRLRQYMQDVATDLGRALTADRALDVDTYLRDRYTWRERPFVVVMNDGRTVSVGGATPPFPGDARGRPLKRPGMPGSTRWPPPPPAGLAEVIVDGQPAGVVLPSPRGRLMQLAWISGGVGALLVLGGTAVAALLVFHPIRRRMREFERAARQLGQGDAGARAPERGNDEWTALARTFNRMAGDLETRAEQIVAGERMRRVLLADVSHELRTPLTTMRGYLDTLSVSMESGEHSTTRRHIEIVQEETHRLERIVGDLLDLATLEVSGGGLDVQDIPVEGLFGRVVARSELDVTRRGIRLTTAIGLGAEIVAGDPLRIEQALQNLVWNSIRHTPPGGLIRLAAEPSVRGVDLVVSDTGAGIPADHLPFVFERFYKVDPARSSESTGSGLGLSIVKAIVERHGGSITVASDVGRGTTFTMHLPDPSAETACIRCVSEM